MLGWNFAHHESEADLRMEPPWISEGFADFAWVGGGVTAVATGIFAVIMAPHEVTVWPAIFAGLIGGISAIFVPWLRYRLQDRIDQRRVRLEERRIDAQISQKEELIAWYRLRLGDSVPGDGSPFPNQQLREKRDAIDLKKSRRAGQTDANGDPEFDEDGNRLKQTEPDSDL
jgi:hypothetical protein